MDKTGSMYRVLGEFKSWLATVGAPGEGVDGKGWGLSRWQMKVVENPLNSHLEKAEVYLKNASLYLLKAIVQI